MSINVNINSFLRERGLIFPPHITYLVYTVLANRGGAILRGPAGVGKTALTYAIACFINAKYIFFQCSLGTSEDDLLVKLVPSEETRSGVKLVLGPLPEALLASREGLVVLCLDEFDKTRPSADALLLDFLQNARVSVRLQNEEIITGKKENLIVFLTSNDEREFSEPLMRRLVSIRIPPLQVEEVFELLRKKFNEEIALLLSQIYEDTQKAMLRKPATIQELVQLGEILSKEAPQAPLSELLRAYIIKYDDDWEKFVSYIETREPYTFLSKEKQEKQEKQEYLIRAYESQKEIKIEPAPAPAPAPEPAPTLPKIPKISWSRNVHYSSFLEEKENDPVVVTEGCVLPSDEEHYDAVIKLFQPAPSESPNFLTNLGEFYKDYAQLKTLGPEELTRLSDEPSLADTFLKNSSCLFSIPLKSPIDHEELIKQIKKLGAKILFYSSDIIRFQLKEQRDHALRVIDVAVIDPAGRTQTQIELVTQNATIALIKKLVASILESQKNIKKINLLVKKAEEEFRAFNMWIRSVSKEPDNTYFYEYIEKEKEEEAKKKVTQIYKNLIESINAIEFTPFDLICERQCLEVSIPSSGKYWLRKSDLPSYIEIKLYNS